MTTYVKKTKEEKVKQSIRLLMEVVEKMDKETYKKYLESVSVGFPHSYSISNTFAIVAQFYAKTGEFPSVVGGAKSFWATVGRRVKREEYGKHGLWILIPIFKNFTTKEKDAKGNDVEKRVKYIVDFRYGKVYDLSQTEGKPYEPKVAKRVSEDTFNIDIEDLISFINKKNIGVSIERKEDILSRGGYVTPTGYTCLNSARGDSDNKSTLFHELAHWFMGHTKQECRLSRNQKEVDAETTAFCLGQKYGVRAASEEYVWGWGEGTNAKPNFEAIFKAFNAIDRLLVEYLGVEEKESAEENVA